MKKTYQVGTMTGIAQIPDDRLHAFIAELPELIRVVREMSSLFDDPDLAVTLAGIQWTDDDAPGLSGVNLEIRTRPEGENP